MRNRNRLGSTAAILAVIGAAWFGVLAFAQTAPKPAAKPTKPSEPAVAVVGGRRITRAAFEQRVREAEEGYRQRSNTPIPANYRPTMRRQVLEGMIREQLLILEARRRGMGLTDAQAEEELKKDAYFQRGGVFDEAKFVTIKNTQPAEFRAALATIQNQLPAVRLKEQLERENSPNTADVKAEIERELSQVTIDFLALRRSAFSAYSPEPSEREVLDYYRAHASEFPRPEQVVLTILSVQQPPLDPSQAGVPGALQTWEARMKERADSLLAGLRKGGRLEDLAPRFGELSKGVEASRDKMPAMWRGTSRVQQSLFSTQVGNHLNESVPGTHGFLLVRVDQKRPPHTASLKEVAVVIRDRLRAGALARKDQEELDQIYASVKDGLRGPAYKIRYAVADTSVFPIKEPTSAEIDRYYRGHLADYSYFDAKTSSVGSKPLSEVRDDVRRRLIRERRVGAARTAADQLLASWKAGKRDSKLERAMTMVRDVGPIPAGGVVDTGAAGSALTDSLASRPGLGIATIRSSRGPVVYHAYSEIKDYTPSRAEARPILEARREPMRTRQEEAGGRRLFDENPGRFRASNVLRFSRLMVNLPEALNVPLTREEVDRHYRSHITEYGAPELIRVRHILLVPKDGSPAADAEARARADDVMRRLKSGESFADLAKKFSDDEGSRDKGGELGVYGHGMMLEDFEHETFSMRPGDLKGPVKTQIGYHVIECLEHAPAETTPLRYAYSTVAADAALEKADRIGRMRADSLRRAIKSPYHAHRAARAMSYSVFQNDHVIGARAGADYLEDYFRRIEKLKPRQFDDRVQEYRGMGYAVTWVDSIMSQSKPRWEDVREQAIDLYRRERDYAILLRKRAELDSLLRAGWTFDSLSTLYGGMETHGPRGPGSGLERLAGRELLDSLAFGTHKTPPVLQVGKPTGWVEFPAGLVMMRLTERRTGDPVQIASRLENETRGRLEARLRKVYDKMSDRYKVEILDQDLKLTELPEMPGS
ncbi:MAG TPA: peptidylprolyl isomerase [Candidatus Eisenbacteria bacterium]|nr:peptidylprolyl isomerase [Candidatus Eisenbacteria bacterium]